jgi:hypothetical protein
MPLSKEKMREYQKSRREKLESLKSDPSLKVLLVDDVRTIFDPIPVPNNLEIMVKDLSDRVSDIESWMSDITLRLKSIERQLSPENVSRQGALKPGSRPTELYGA